MTHTPLDPALDSGKQPPSSPSPADQCGKNLFNQFFNSVHFGCCRSCLCCVASQMPHGTKTEPQARAQYTMKTGRMFKKVGFIPHPSSMFAGASPDGLVGDDGMLEIKCTHAS
jgi:hypothetical protein